MVIFLEDWCLRIKQVGKPHTMENPSCQALKNSENITGDIDETIEVLMSFRKFLKSMEIDILRKIWRRLDL